MSCINYVWEYIINFIELLLFLFFIYVKLDKPTYMQHSFLKKFIFLTIYFVIKCVLNFLETASLITILTTCIFEVTFAIIFYSNTIAMCIFWGSMYSVLCIVAEYITIFIPKTFSKVPVSEVLLGGELRVPVTLLYITLITIFIFLFYYIGNKTIFWNALQKWLYIVIFFVGLSIAHYILIIELEVVVFGNTSSISNSLMLINLFFIVLFLALLFYIYQLGNSKEQNIKLLEQQKIHELEELEYENLIKTTKLLREMKHDMEIHLIMIRSLAAKNAISELMNYIEGYYDKLEQMHHFISTGNIAIDCILSNKIDTAEKLGIEVTYSIIIPYNFPLEPLEVSSLLGNLWNNSIEACQRLQKKESKVLPYIQFYIKPFQDMVAIHIENNYDGILKIEKNNSYGSVKLKNGHGIGLTRIKTIIEKANGIIQIQTDKNLFQVHILIPQKESNYENEYSNNGR